MNKNTSVVQEGIIVVDVPTKRSKTLLAEKINGMKKYAKANGIKVSNVYILYDEDCITAENQLKELIKWVEVQKKPIAILCDTIDIFSDHYRILLSLRTMLQQGKIELHALQNGLVVNKQSDCIQGCLWDIAIIWVKQLAEWKKRYLRLQQNYL